MHSPISIVSGVYNKTERERILVLLSTFNGEKYISQQLDSILNQVDVNVSILIRDDGSSDNTLSILEHYKENHSNIDYYSDCNLGVIASFNNLLLRPELDLYDYFAFCDQDDVWDVDKLAIAINLMGNDQDVPVLYCSNLLVVDENLSTIKAMRKPIKKYTRSMATVQNIGTGCTQVFNKKALEEYRKGIKSRMEMHDYWMTLVCMYLGVLIYDNNCHIKYRQHSDNVIGAKDKTITSAVKHIKNYSCGIRIGMLKDFLCVYDLSNDDRKIIGNVTEYNQSVFSRVKLMSLRYRGITNSVTIGFKIRALLGKMY